MDPDKQKSSCFQKKYTTGPQIRVCNGKLFSYLSTKTYDVGTVITVAITAIYLSKQGVSDLGYTQAHVSFHL